MRQPSKYLQGVYTPKNPAKYEGNPTNIIYRSSWELRFFNWCDTSPGVVKWSSEETVVPYICPTDGRAHRYFVDAKVQIKGKDGKIRTYLIEVKPEKETRPPKERKRKTKGYWGEIATWGRNQAKWEAANEYAKRRGWEFKLLTEKELGIKKATK